MSIVFGKNKIVREKGVVQKKKNDGQTKWFVQRNYRYFTKRTNFPKVWKKGRFLK